VLLAKTLTSSTFKLALIAIGTFGLIVSGILSYVYPLEGVRDSLTPNEGSARESGGVRKSAGTFEIKTLEGGYKIVSTLDRQHHSVPFKIKDLKNTHSVRTLETTTQFALFKIKYLAPGGPCWFWPVRARGRPSGLAASRGLTPA
jgi:hypothetical protein